jgi:hypothetical protein
MHEADCAICLYPFVPAFYFLATLSFEFYTNHLTRARNETPYFQNSVRAVLRHALLTCYAFVTTDSPLAEAAC